MSKREEYNLKFNKRIRNNGKVTFDCEGISSDGRSQFITTILEGHNDVMEVGYFLREIDLALNGQMDDLDEFWQPDSITDSFRCFITPPSIILGKNNNYTLPLQDFKELLLEWKEFLES